MTKNFLAAVCVFLILSASVAQALPLISVNPVAPAPGIPATDNAAIEVYTFSVAGPGGFAYDTINFAAVAGAPFNHTENMNGILNFAPGNQDTDFLGGPIFGSGLAVIGVNDLGGPAWNGVITTFGGGDTSALNGPFAQLTLPQGTGGAATISFALAGSTVGLPEVVLFGIPEPGTMALACLGLVGVFVGRRRS